MIDFRSEGGQYFEKTLQAVFDIPPIPSELLFEAFEHAVGDLFDVPEAESVRFMNLFYHIVGPNLRSPRAVIQVSTTPLQVLRNCSIRSLDAMLR